MVYHHFYRYHQRFNLVHAMSKEGSWGATLEDWHFALGLSTHLWPSPSWREAGGGSFHISLSYITAKKTFAFYLWLTAISKYWVPLRVPNKSCIILILNPEVSVSYLKFLQDFVIFSMIFTKVFHFFAFWTASIVFHFCTLWVDFRAFWLITNRSILSTDTGTVGMSREKTFSQFVHKATVIHAALPSVVIKDQVVITGGLIPFVGRVVFMIDGSWSHQTRNYQQKYPGFMDM